MTAVEAPLPTTTTTTTDPTTATPTPAGRAGDHDRRAAVACCHRPDVADALDTIMVALVRQQLDHAVQSRLLMANPTESVGLLDHRRYDRLRPIVAATPVT